MENTFSDNFKKFFLLTFAKELIVHSAKKDIIKLQNIIESEEKKKRIIPARRMNFNIEPERKIKSNITIVKSKPITRQIEPPSSLNIPQQALPPHLEYLKPVPVTSNISIDLGKLNPLIHDKSVSIIEINPDEKTKVTGTMGTKPTGIILSKEDISSVIDAFSKISKIPANEGVYKVVSDNLILSAIISNNFIDSFVCRYF